MTTGAERRRFGRAPIQAMVQLRGEGLPSGGQAFKTINLSAGGLFVQTPSPLPTGTRVHLGLELPTEERSFLELEGEVAWVREPGMVADSRAGMGIRFVSATPEQEQEVRRLVNRAMLDNLADLLYTKLRSGAQRPDADEPSEPDDASEG